MKKGRKDSVKKLQKIDSAMPAKHDDEVSRSDLGFDSPTDKREFVKELKAKEDEVVEEIADQFVHLKSSASTNISNIEGFIYGGVSSRFWLFRKHMMCLDYNTIKHDTREFKEANKNKIKGEKIPFYAWQCITLILSHR